MAHLLECPAIDLESRSRKTRQTPDSASQPPQSRQLGADELQNLLLQLHQKLPSLCMFGLRDDKRIGLVQLRELVADTHYHDAGHSRMLKNHRFQHRGRNVRAIPLAYLEELFDAVDNEDVAVLVQIAVVARVEPALRIEVSIGLLVVLIALEATELICARESPRTLRVLALVRFPR